MIYLIAWRPRRSSRVASASGHSQSVAGGRATAPWRSVRPGSRSRPRRPAVPRRKRQQANIAVSPAKLVTRREFADDLWSSRFDRRVTTSTCGSAQMPAEPAQSSERLSPGNGCEECLPRQWPCYSHPRIRNRREPAANSASWYRGRAAGSISEMRLALAGIWRYAAAVAAVKPHWAAG